MKLKNMNMTKIKTSKPFLFQHFTGLQLVHLYPQMRGSNKEPIYDLSKGGLISESFSIWHKKGAKSQSRVKLTFSKKATKIDKIFTVNLTVCSNCQIDGEDFVNFCGLLRKHKLYATTLIIIHFTH